MKVYPSISDHEQEGSARDQISSSAAHHPLHAVDRGAHVLVSLLCMLKFVVTSSDLNHVPFVLERVQKVKVRGYVVISV